MSNFTNLDRATLVTVTGGAGAPNTDSTKASTNVGVTYKGTQVGVRGSATGRPTSAILGACAS